MARIALTIGIGVLGAVSGGLGWLGFLGIGASAAAGAGFSIGGAILGGALGLSIGSTLANIIFPGHLPGQFGPRLNDLSVMTSANGASVPFGYGKYKVSGNVIWSPGLVEHSQTVTQSGGGKGGPTVSSTNYTYTVDMAVAFGEGVGTVLKIWGDAKVLYDGSNGAFVPFQGDFNNTHTYAIGDVVHYDNKYWVAQLPQNSLPSLPPEIPPFGGLFWIQYAGTVTTNAVQKYPAPVLYTGSNTQMPDPTVQAALGTGNASAWRGLIYGVWTQLLLTDFGNRIPNIVAVVGFGTKYNSPPIGLKAGSITSYIYNSTSNGGFNLKYGGSLGHPKWNFGPDAGMTAPGFPNATQSAPSVHWEGQLGQNLRMATLNSGGTVTGWTDTGHYENWETAIVGSIIINTPGTYPFNLSHDDGAIISFKSSAISGGGTASRVTGTVINTASRGTSAYAGYTDVAGNNNSGNWPNDPFSVNFSAAGEYGFEINYTNWEHRGHVILTCNGNELVTVSVGGSGTDTTDLGYIVTDICKRAGLDPSLLDVTAITGQKCQGYAIGRPSDARAILAQLCTGYFFDIVESDFKLRTIPRGQVFTMGVSPVTTTTLTPPGITIPELDLGLMDDGAKLEEQIAQEQDKPQLVQVVYSDPSLDFQQGKQEKRRNSRTHTTQNQIMMELPFVMSQNEARQVAEKTLYLAWLESQPAQFNVWKAQFARLDPTDVIQYVYNGLTFIIRVTDNTVGQGYSIAISGVSEDSRNYLSTALGNNADTQVPVVQALPDTILWLFDISYLQDSDASSVETGFYWIMSSDDSKWAGGVLYRSTNDADYSSIGSSGARATFGSTTGALGDPPEDCFVWDDTNTLNVNLENGTLSSASDLDVLNGTNVLLVGNELIQYGNAHLELDGSWTLSHLLRGRRNSDVFSTGHAASELVFDPTTGMQHATSPLTIVGLNRFYRGVTIGADISTGVTQDFTINANDLKPIAPCHIKGSRDISNNLTIDWIRRTRYAGDWLNGTGFVPLNESTEAYEIDIMSGLTVKRTIVWAGTLDSDGNPTAAYSAADQTSDSFTPGQPIEVNVYQLSAQVGRGFAGNRTI